MKCPYAVTCRMVSRTTFEYDEDGNQTSQQTVENNNAEFVTCLERECGAWRDGRCQYRGIE